MMMYSAANGSLYPWAIKQIIFFFSFLSVALLISLIDIRAIYNFSYLAYGGVIILLILVELFGYTAMGAKRWINLGLLRIQPAEIAKIATILALARYFHNIKYEDLSKVNNSHRILQIIIPLIIILLPASLIIKQPDLGTGILLILVGGIIFFTVGVNLWFFNIGAITALCSMPLLWNHLHDYQKQRILMFFSPEQDPLGAGYNIIQSTIAIGSGGLLGKGFLQGTQSHLSFIPEHQTDFIFPSFAEEFGFLGAIVLIIIQFLICYFSLSIGTLSKNIYGKVLASGVAGMFFVHSFINIGMVTGLLPVVGVPLPFMSYGGTIMGSMLIGFGLIFNVKVHSNININH